MSGPRIVYVCKYCGNEIAQSTFGHWFHDETMLISCGYKAEPLLPPAA